MGLLLPHIKYLSSSHMYTYYCSFFTHRNSPKEFIVESSHDFSQFLCCCGIKPKARTTHITAMVRGAHRLLVKPLTATAIIRATVRREERERRGEKAEARERRCKM